MTPTAGRSVATGDTGGTAQAPPSEWSGALRAGGAHVLPLAYRSQRTPLPRNVETHSVAATPNPPHTP